MGSTTSKGYPYPVGTDRVMDGDDAIKALAEAVNADSQWTKATTVGHALTGATATAVQWNAANPNGCALTKTSSTVWTVTIAGLYVVTGCAFTTGFQPAGQRAYMQLKAGPLTGRQGFDGENTTAPSLAGLLVPGDTITFEVFPSAGTNVAASTGTLSVCRLGRWV